MVGTVAGLVLLLLHGSAARADDCTPVPIEVALTGAPGQAILLPFTDPNYFTPEGFVDWVYAAGIATTDGRALEWALQIDHRVRSQGNVCCWLVPLQASAGVRSMTPPLALDHPVILLPGDRISARTPNILPDRVMGLMWLAIRYPIACLPRVLGLSPIMTSSTGGGTLPDYSALVAAAAAAATKLTAAATALEGVAGSIP